MRELEKRSQDDANDADANSDSDGEFVYLSVPKQLRDIDRAQGGFLEDCRGSLKANDPLVEIVINGEKSHSSLRLVIWRKISATAAYLSLKNMPYVTAEWL